MFYFLVIVGLLLILAGIYTDKSKTPVSSRNLEDLRELDSRLSQIEGLLFKNLMQSENQKNEDRDTDLDLDIDHGDISDKYKLLEKYEKQNRSLEEICSLLDMPKGEVLLLKNLYKNYSN